MRGCWPPTPLAVVGLASVQLAAAPAVQPKRASFDISNAFTIKVPEGAKRVRVWFAVPQGDTESEIRALKVEAPYPIRYGTDSSGNRVGYLEVNAPQEADHFPRDVHPDADRNSQSG